MTDLVGQTFGRYYLTRLLEREAIAEVYLAEDSYLQRPVVLKVWDSQPEETMQMAFWHSIRPLVRLDHPHINAIYDFGIQEQRPFIVQKYAPQGSLRQQHPHGSKLPLGLVVQYVTQVADALQYAHDQHIVHGNLMPENILLEFGDKLLLNGFRIVIPTDQAFTREDTTHTRASSYMAPEQLVTGQAEPASDQYSLAAMAYEWLHGVPPFYSDAQQVQQEQQSDNNPSMTGGREPAIPQVLEHIVMKALTRETTQRFSSVREFASAFEAACEGYGGVPTQSVRVFFSYAQRDQSLCDQLENHLSNLKYRRLITTWSARKIKAGEDARQQIDISLSTSHIILLLISANFLASEYCYSQEMMRAIRRHERGEVHVIPVLLRPVLFTDAPFANLKPLPTNQKPVVTWRNRDSAFVDIAIGIEHIAKERINANSQHIHPSPPSTTWAKDWYPYPSLPSMPSGALPPYAQPQQPYMQSGPLQSIQPESEVLSPYTLDQPSIPERIRQTTLTLLLSLWPPLRRKWKRQRQEQELIKRHQREQALIQEQQEQLQREQEESRRRHIEASGLSVQEYEYYEQALDAYEQAIDEDRNDAAAHRGRGHALAALQRYVQALQAFEEAQQLMPLAVTYVSIGDILTAMERWNEAVDAYNQALTLDASSATAYAGLSEALAQMGRTQEAEKAYAQAKLLGLED